MTDSHNELLKRSCDRLLELVKLNASASIVFAEFSQVSKLMIEVIRDAMDQSVRRELERWREHKATKVAALDIMDKGRHNPEGNSTMLWDRDWNRLRAILLEATEVAEEEK